MTDPIQIEIARVQTELDSFKDRLEVVERDLAALRDRQGTVAAEGFVAGMDAATDGERKTYADFEWSFTGEKWSNLVWEGLANEVPDEAAERRLADGDYAFRCRHTHAPVTAAQIRAAVEGPKKLNPDTGRWDAPVLAAHEGNGFDDIDTREVRL